MVLALYSAAELPFELLLLLLQVVQAGRTVFRSPYSFFCCNVLQDNPGVYVHVSSQFKEGKSCFMWCIDFRLFRTTFSPSGTDLWLDFVSFKNITLLPKMKKKK